MTDMAPPNSPQSHDAAFASDRCLAIIDGNFMAPRCRLKLGHDGPHEPIVPGKQTITESQAFADFRPAEKLTLRAKVRSIFRV